jgi:hypothetical protein
MANAGKTIVKIKAPVMMVQTQNKIKEPVWMEKDFFPNLLDLIKEYKIEIKGIEFLNEHVKIFFKDKDHAMKFRLVYEGKN